MTPILHCGPITHTFADEQVCVSRRHRHEAFVQKIRQGIKNSYCEMGQRDSRQSKLRGRRTDLEKAQMSAMLFSPCSSISDLPSLPPRCLTFLMGRVPKRSCTEVIGRIVCFFGLLIPHASLDSTCGKTTTLLEVKNCKSGIKFSIFYSY